VEKIENIKNEERRPNHPQINDLSRAIMEEKDTDFELRNKMLLQKQKNTALFEGLEEMQACTFKPDITNLGKQAPSKNPAQRAYGDKLVKQFKHD
jgi:hypothetical protein